MATTTKKKRDKKFDPKKAARLRARGDVVHTFTLEAANRLPLEESEIDTIMMPVLGSLDALQFGELDTEGFVILNEANCIAWSMGRIVLQDGGATPGNLSIAMSLKEHSERAAEALTAIGERYKKTDRFGTSATELQDVRDAMSWYRRLLEVLDSGQVMRAMKEGAQMVNDAIHNGGRRLAKAA